MNSGVYEIFNTSNGKRYIGGAVDFTARWRGHMHDLKHGRHRNQKLQRAWEKYGPSAFTFRPMMLCGREQVLFFEQQYLDEFRPEYNIALTADAVMTGRKHALESRAKMSASKVGRKYGPPSEKHRLALSIANAGRKNTTEQRIRQSLAQTGKKRKPHSEETKAKMSAAARGRILSESTRAKISAVQLGKKRGPHSLAHRAALSASHMNRIARIRGNF